ncbi:MAG: SH3 domain-containing protein [Armatimonadetes bacterium]|nr:SH3 domain-containing protein [Armatimonadota bacterium]
MIASDRLLLRFALLLAASTAALPPWSACASSVDVAEIFARANESYDKGDFASAAAGYARCVELGADGADVLYNLGNARARSHQPGQAMAAYWAARRIAPRDPDLLSNMEQLTAMRADAAPQVPRSWLMAAAGGLVLRFTVNELAGAALLALLALTVAGVLLILREGPQRRLWVVFLVLALATVVTGASAWAKWDHDYRHPPAFVTGDPATMRSGPGRHFEVTGNLQAGTQVEPIRRSGIWTEIRLATGKRAWLEESSLARPPEARASGKHSKAE